MTDPKPGYEKTVPLSPDGEAASGKRASLVVYHRDGVQVVALEPGRPIVVGREPPADVVLPDSSLSRRHARFTPLEDEVMVQDLESTNGVLVGGRRVDRAVLRSGEQAVLGAVTISVHALSGNELAAPDMPGHEAFRGMLEDEVARARHFGRQLAVLLVRAVGDERHVSHWRSRVQAAIRPIDRVALYGPEAVEILLPEASLEEARRIADAIVKSAGSMVRLLCGGARFPEAASGEEIIAVAVASGRAATADRPVRFGVDDAARPSATETEGPVAKSASMVDLLALAERVARSPIPVLLHGETGTGKEVLARFLHERGPRKAAPLVCVNCAAIPSQLVESTLFGHERGAFTGATQQQHGVFEAAQGGTVLLDEIGELPAAAQAALLRVLETKRLVRVGGTRELDVDVRVVAATHRDLEGMCASGSFREDLYYRLNVMTLKIPPLRERRDDIAALAGRFLRAANEANQTDIRSIADRALTLLERYAWPGNIRELRNAIDRAVVITRGDSIGVEDLPERVRAGAGALAGAGIAALAAAPPVPREPTSSRTEPEPVAADEGDEGDDYRSRIKRYETELLLDALRRAGGNQTVAAELLGMPLRTLKHKIKALGIKKLGFGAPE